MNRIFKTTVSLLLVLCLALQIVPIFSLASANGAQTANASEENNEAMQITTRLPSKADKFTDVKKDKWYYEPICYVTDNGIFSGTSETTFSPNGAMTRAMVVTVLANLAGVNLEDYRGETGFSDVTHGSWYEAQVAWAAKYGITAGTGNGKFSPERPVTRQEIATLFVKYFTLFGVSLGDDNVSDSEPADLSTCASWAQQSILVLWQRGLMVGDGSGAFVPERIATRAECAVICMQFHKTVDEWKAAPGETQWIPAKPGSDRTYSVTFKDEDGTVLTTMSTNTGLGLGEDKVPYHADPDPDNGIYFWGWFFTDDNGELHLFNALYPYNHDLTVQAISKTKAEMSAYIEDEYYVVEEKVDTSYSFTVRPSSPDSVFDAAEDLAIYINDYYSRIDYSAEEQSNGDYVIHLDNLRPGAYCSVVVSEDFIFVMPDENGEEVVLDPHIRYCEFTVNKSINGDLLFREDVVWIPTSEFNTYSLQNERGLGVERAADDTSTPLGTGGFMMNNNKSAHSIAEGTVIGVYSDNTVSLTDAGGNPINVQRQAPYCREYEESAYEGLGYTYSDLYSNANDRFYIVTSVRELSGGKTACEFRELSLDEMDKYIYIPDVIPFMTETLPDSTVGTVGTVENYAAYDAQLYAGYRGEELPSPRIGDFVILYTAAAEYLGENELDEIRKGTYKGEIPFVYGTITSVDGMELTYEVLPQADVLDTLNYFDTYYIERYVPTALQPEVPEEEIRAFEEDTEQLLDEEAIKAFVSEAIDEDVRLGSKEAAQAKEILENNEIYYANENGPQLRGGKAPDDTKKIEVTGKAVSASLDTSRVAFLKNTEGKWKAALNVGMMLIVKLKLNEDMNLYYVISGNFTQELALGVSASGHFDVKWYLFVPVPQRVEFSVSVTADTATDVTLDVRHYRVDKTHYSPWPLYGRQASEQEMWNNFQEFLLSDAFVCHGSGLYAKEAEYYTLVDEALAIDEKNVNEREAADKKVQLKAKEINEFWEDKEYGLDKAWDLYFNNGGSKAFAEAEAEAAKKAAAEAKDSLVANVINYTQNIRFVGDIVDYFTTEAKSEVEDATKGMQELADLNPDGTETEEWKQAQKKLEAAKAETEEQEKKNKEQKEKEKQDRANLSKDIESFIKNADEKLKTTQGVLSAAVTSVETIIAQMRADEEQNAASIEKMEKVLNSVQTALELVTTARKVLSGLKNVFSAIMSVVRIAKGDTADGIDVIAEIYNTLKSLNSAMKDCKIVLADMQSSYFKEGDGHYERCQEGIDFLLKFTTYSDTVMELLEKAALLLGCNLKPGYSSRTDGISDVPTTSSYWKFRTFRTGDFLEFSLNTELVDRLNSPEDGLDDENMDILAKKYAEMCAITNTWMDLYRKELVNKDIPIFVGLDANIGVDFVIQANVNVAVNFNFHVEYGKEFRITIDILHAKISTDCLDRSNQTLSISLLAMGTLGFRIGFEVKFGIKIIKIFTVSATVEIMPYINLYAYAFFQYKRDLTNGDSTMKYMGAMYIDIGIHIGINLALKMDILVYKNTWKWNLWNKNITLADIGERRNVYNFGYPQASPVALEGSEEALNALVSGTPQEKDAQNLETDGIMIVSKSTGYQVPAAARYMSFMDMANGALGKISFDADHYTYKFFRVPQKGDGQTYAVENNLPVQYKMVEMPVTDENGNIIYKENNGAGIPLDITIDADRSGYDKDFILAANNGTPVTELVQSDQLIFDAEGVKAGKYVEDTRFRADAQGKITFEPDDGATGTLVQDVYLYIEWKTGSLEFSNYPVRRLVHILWTNEEPLSYVNAEIVAVEDNRVTGGTDEYVVWNKTFIKGFSFAYFPPLEEVLAAADPDEMLWDREQTTYVGVLDNRGTGIPHPQQDMRYYIQTKIKEYALEVRGLNADGTERVESYSEEYGYTLPIPETFTPQITTKDDSGNPKYLKFAGYLARQDNNGTVENWTGRWDEPITSALALDLMDENIDRYLEAVYEDETVKAVFTFIDSDQEQITQYLRRGSAPDMNAIEAVINGLRAQAASEGKTLNVEWSQTPGVQASDTEYTIFCHTSYIEAPTVTQVGSEFKVRLSTAETKDEDDVILYGYAPDDGSDMHIKWLANGVDTVEVEPNLEYSFFVCKVDGATLERTYSAAAVKTISGERSDTGYTTTFDVYSYAANPTTPIQVTVKIKYTTQIFSEPQTFELKPDETVTVEVPNTYTPDLFGSVYVSVTDLNGDPVSSYYKLSISGFSEKEDELWISDTNDFYIKPATDTWLFGSLNFSLAD
ncbi:MAG: S-layer homology domain-containing protein [Clostridia bacterium]|nr:S-layer homology domain-containing protein [Clostridia bacterium]